MTEFDICIGTIVLLPKSDDEVDFTIKVSDDSGTFTIYFNDKILCEGDWAENLGPMLKRMLEMKPVD